MLFLSACREGRCCATSFEDTIERERPIGIVGEEKLDGVLDNSHDSDSVHLYGGAVRVGGRAGGGASRGRGRGRGSGRGGYSGGGRGGYSRGGI
eukprot:COSAG05_NODE_14_length_36349_cov_27.641655_19_plen_94_part_00